MEEKEFDEEMEGDVVELESEDGETVKFRHVATIDHKGDWYVLFSPVEEIEGLDEDECVIFKLGTDDKGGDVFLPVEDDALLDEVYDEYVRIMEDEGDWECGCEDCSKSETCACKDKPEEECDCESCEDGRSCECEEEHCDCDEGGCDCGADHAGKKERCGGKKDHCDGKKERCDCGKGHRDCGCH